MPFKAHRIKIAMTLYRLDACSHFKKCFLLIDIISLKTINSVLTATYQATRRMRVHQSMSSAPNIMKSSKHFTTEHFSVAK